MKQPALSFIIPAFNEEKFLPHALSSINRFVPESLPYEIVVADNGSQDNTVNIAKGHAEVFVDDTATVGGLRNRAVEKTKGEVLIFLDADILLTEEWGERIKEVYEGLIIDPWQVTGSRCGIPENASWIERYWFTPLVKKRASATIKYINSGHLITTPKLFRQIGGFDEKLETGEDYAFGRSAEAANAKIINDPLLTVVHEGYPKTLRQFIKREIWHGRGDCKSIQTIKSSKVAIAAIVFMGLHILAIFGLLTNLKFGVVAALSMVAICIVFALYKHDVRAAKNLIIVSTLYYFYLVSRCLSCLPIFSAKQGRDKPSEYS